ncbi:hypothetical protein OHC33_002013 [Knufia fluminis]|uniref:Uncharacterized protein n=1 Tax=Knufia fluminis TaxID=191047 RepID=A0AAN8EQG0_9EURO|nr:hypothetical protein OHC33_002013 [Knufia fluminis]
MFFDSWPVWAKLTFVLGGSFVVILAVAGLAKLHKHLKIKNLTKAGDADVERAEIRQRIRSSDEIPFGAKAMLEDPDIEGVWNSRASTPLQSPVLAPRSSSHSRLSLNPFSRSRRNSSVSSLSQLDLPQRSPSNASAETVSPSPKEPTGASSSTVPMLSRNSQDTPWQYQVHMPYAQDQLMPRRRSVTIRATSRGGATAGETAQSDAGQVRQETQQKQRSRVSTDPLPETPTHERRGRTLVVGGPAAESIMLERTPTIRKALDRMEAHRRFHAAESGQLQPRLRFTEEKSFGHKHSASDSFFVDTETTRAVSWPITPGEVLVNFNAPQKVQTMTSPHVVPFRAFVEMHPPPKSSPKAPPSAWTDRTQGMLDEKLEAQAPKKRITIRNNHAGKNARELYTLTNNEEDKDEDENFSLLGTQLRRINKGFEILPAGSLDEPSPVKDFGYSKEPLREKSNDSKPRKLQKRSRSRSMEHRTSLDTVRHVKFEDIAVS